MKNSKYLFFRFSSESIIINKSINEFESLYGFNWVIGNILYTKTFLKDTQSPMYVLLKIFMDVDFYKAQCNKPVVHILLWENDLYEPIFVFF